MANEKSLESARGRVSDLTLLLTQARDAYYKLNSPIMPDAEYDKLEHELQSLVAEFPVLAKIAEPILKSVGSDLATNGRTPHTRPMLSIENNYTEADLLAWVHAILNAHPQATFCLEPKFDGVSVSLLFQNHKLVRALTRGDGKSGEDITPQVRCVMAIPRFLPDRMPADMEIRGELVMKNRTLERLNREAEAKGGKIYSSTRNLTGGTMKLKDLSLIPNREIEMMPWDVLGDDAALPDSGLERLRLLVGKDAFRPPFGTVVNSAAAVGATLQEKLADRERVMRQIMSLETDGVVIKVDSHKLRRKLGVASKYTNYQTCFKPQSASGTTYLREIQWQIGRTGKLSPVAICDPVVLAGAKVTNASLNNITWIKEKGLKLGAKVEMLRSGDVIPQIVRVIDEGDCEIVPPTSCPECLTLLVQSDEGGAGTITHRCPNKGCPGRVRDTLTFIGSRDVLEIDGLGPEMASRLATDAYARDIAQLYNFQSEAKAELKKLGEETFVERMRQRGFDVTVLKLIKSLEQAKTASWERWVKALAIPMIGATLGKAVAMSLDLQSGDMRGLVTKLIAFTKQQTEGFGEAKLAAISDWANDTDNASLCNTLYEAGVRPAPVEKPKVVAGAPLAGVAFCITGEFAEDRDSITTKLISLGAMSKTGVSSKTNLLIVGPTGAGKSKLTKAAQLGIQQVGKEWLVKTLTENGLKFDEAFEVESA